MKNMPATVNWLLFAAAVVFGIVVYSCTSQTGSEHGGKISITKDHILIHPGAEISREDQEAMNAVLSHYNKSLYKLQTYKNGKLVETRGKLSDVKIDKSLTSEVAQAIQNGFSDSVLQISKEGVSCHTDHVDHGASGTGPMPSPNVSNSKNLSPVPGMTPTHTDHVDHSPNSACEAKQLEAILAKYTRR